MIVAVALTLHALSLGAVLELSRTDGAASRIEFGVTASGSDASLSGDVNSINASVPLLSPNIMEMAARIAQLEELVSQQQVILSTSPGPTPRNP